MERIGFRVFRECFYGEDAQSLVRTWSFICLDSSLVGLFLFSLGVGMFIDIAIALNQGAQGVKTLDELTLWFEQFELIGQKEVLRQLLLFISQAGFLQKTDAENATTLSQLKRTYTPCVLITKDDCCQQLSKIINLPSNEYRKAFRLLAALFFIIDNRRRDLSCKGQCRHWWHCDLSVPENLESIRARYRNFNLG
jgi:hypothetical protein